MTCRLQDGIIANPSVIAVLRSSSVYERYPVLHDPNDMAMQSESIVYLIHDDESVRERAGEIVESIGLAAQVVESTEEFLDAYDEGRDSCLITDLRLGRTTGIDLLQAMREQSISSPVIFLSAHADVRLTVDVMRRGAVTLLEVPFQKKDLVASIQEAIERDSVVRKTNLRRHAIRSYMETLTPKERTVLDLVVDGMANKVIAKRLSVSIRTIESRRQAVFHKMHATNLAELVRSVMDAEAGIL